MANQIVTQKTAVNIAATLKAELPILQFVNKTCSNKLEGGKGSSVGVVIPNYGKVSEGESFLNESENVVRPLGTIADLDIIQEEVLVKTKIKKVGARYNLIEKQLELINKGEQVDEPRLSNLAQNIHAEIFKCLFTSANTAMVGPMGFPELGEAVSYVKKSRVDGKLAGVLDTVLNTNIIASGQQRFAHSKIGEDLYKGLLGNYAGCEFIESPDAGMLQLGTQTAEDWAFSCDVAPLIDGSEQLVLTNIKFGGSALGVIPIGTPITIGSGNPTKAGSIQSPFTLSDVYGNNTGIARTFIVIENAKVNGTSAIVRTVPLRMHQKVGDAVTPSNAAVPNTWYSGDAAQDSLKAFTPLFAGARYVLGVVFKENAIAFASTSLVPFENNSTSKSTSLDGELNVRISVDGDIVQGVNMFRAEACYGMNQLYGSGACALYCQVI